MADLAIIIPCLTPDAALAETLEHLRNGSDPLTPDIIVSLPEGVEMGPETAGRFGARAVNGPKGRSAQLTRGAAAARDAKWLFFLHADTHLPMHWGRLVDAHMHTRSEAASFRLGFRARGFKAWHTAAWANYRAGRGLPYGDQGLLISRDLFSHVGGYPDIPLMEDVAIAQALDGQIKILNGIVSTSAKRYQENGWWRQGAGNLIRLIRYLRGVPASELARDYR